MLRWWQDRQERKAWPWGDVRKIAAYVELPRDLADDPVAKEKHGDIVIERHAREVRRLEQLHRCQLVPVNDMTLTLSDGNPRLFMQNKVALLCEQRFEKRRP